MKSKDFEPKFQHDFEDDAYDKKPQKGGWWRLPVGVLVSLALGCAIGGGAYAIGHTPSKTAAVETEAVQETRKTYAKAEKKESAVSVTITTDDAANTDTDTVVKLLIKDEDGRTSIDEIEVALNKLTEVGSLKKGSYILYIIRVPVSDKGTTYTLADNGIRFDVAGDGMAVELELKLSSSADGSTKVEVTNSEDAGVTYSYVNADDYYYYDSSTIQGTGGSNNSSTTSNDNGGSAKEPVDNGSSGIVDGGTTDGGTTDGGTTDGGTSDGGAADGGATDGGTTDGGYTDGGATDGGYTDGGAGEVTVDAGMAE